MKRTHRAILAKETVEIVKRGPYRMPYGKIVNIAAEIEAAKMGTAIYDSVCRGPDTLQDSMPTARIEVTNESTFAALRRLDANGEQGIGCLNFASAKFRAADS